MKGAAARLTLEDFADATGLPLAALQHPLSHAPLKREPLPCPLCEERANEQSLALEAAKQLRADIVQSLQLSLQTQIEHLRQDMHERQTKALDAVLSALLPALGDAVLRQRLAAEITAGLRRDMPLTLYVPDGMEVGDIPGTDQCKVVTDPALETGQVTLQQARGRTDINPGAIVSACLQHLDQT